LCNNVLSEVADEGFRGEADNRRRRHRTKNIENRRESEKSKEDTRENERGERDKRNNGNNTKSVEKRTLQIAEKEEVTNERIIHLNVPAISSQRQGEMCKRS